MNIYAENGDKVTVTEKSIKNGHRLDRVTLDKYLKIGEIYTVDYTNVGGWITDVYLKEFPNVAFNSVMLEDVKEVENKTKDILIEVEKVEELEFIGNHPCGINKNYKTSGKLLYPMEVGGSVTIITERGTLFSTSEIVEINETTFKTKNSVYSYILTSYNKSVT